MNGLFKVWQQFITVVIIDWNAKKMWILNEVGLWACGANVQFISDVVILMNEQMSDSWINIFFFN